MEAFRLEIIKHIVMKIAGHDTDYKFDTQCELLIRQFKVAYPTIKKICRISVPENRLTSVLQDYSLDYIYIGVYNNEVYSYYEELSQFMRYLINKEIQCRKNDRYTIIKRHFGPFYSVISKYDSTFYGYCVKALNISKYSINDITYMNTGYIVTTYNDRIDIRDSNLRSIKTLNNCKGTLHVCKNKIILAFNSYIKIYDIVTKDLKVINDINISKVVCSKDTLVYCVNNELKVYDLQGTLLYILPVGYIYDFVVLSDGRIATVGIKINIWNGSVLEKVLAGHYDDARKIAVYDNILVTASDCDIKTWDLNTYECINTMPTTTVTHLYINKGIVVSSLVNGNIKVWNGNVCKYQTYRKNVQSIQYFTDSQVLIFVEDEAPIIWNISTGEIDHTLRDYSGQIICGVMHKGTIICGTNEGSILHIE